MKKGFAWCTAILLLLSGCAASAEEPLAAPEAATSILIAYFSRAQEIYPTELDGYSAATPRVNNTEQIALMIQEITGGELFQIQTERIYPVDHGENSEIAGAEKEDNDRPVLTTQVQDMAQYDTVFLGYPLWWYTAPMAVRTFLEEYDFTGKRIIPFATSLGAGISESISDIQTLCPAAIVEEGLLLPNSQADRTQDVSQWLIQLGFMPNQSTAE